MFSGFAQLALGGASLSEGPVVILGGGPRNRRLLQKSSYLRGDLVHDLRGFIETTGQQQIQVGQQPGEKNTDLGQGLKSTQCSNSLTKSLIPAWRGNAITPEALNNVTDI